MSSLSKVSAWSVEHVSLSTCLANDSGETLIPYLVYVWGENRCAFVYLMHFIASEITWTLTLSCTGCVSFSNIDFSWLLFFYLKRCGCCVPHGPERGMCAGFKEEHLKINLSPKASAFWRLWPDMSPWLGLMDINMPCEIVQCILLRFWMR